MLTVETARDYPTDWRAATPKQTREPDGVERRPHAGGSALDRRPQRFGFPCLCTGREAARVEQQGCECAQPLRARVVHARLPILNGADMYADARCELLL